MKCFEIFLDCGALGSLPADVQMIGPSVTRVYLKVGGSSQFDVRLFLSDKSIELIKSICEAQNDYYEYRQQTKD